MVGNDFGEAFVALAEFRGFGQQLGGMTDGAQGIADFMGDTGGQPPQRCQFNLLGLLGELCAVIDQDQSASACVCLQFAEPRNQGAASPLGLKSLRLPLAVVFPVIQLLRKTRRRLLEPPQDLLVEFQQRAGGFVSQADILIRADDQHAGLQLLDDVLVELLQIGQIDTALLGQRLALSEAYCQHVGECGGGKQYQAQQARTGYVAGTGVFQRQAGEPGFEQQDQGGDSGKQISRSSG